ncbi:glycosyltransferase family 2 protein [Caldinitratiruptor microaerophilus]|uniref:glycosyltransferase family 2 protein n=1 Tax=Caldinitratiruptor microaerophilus TaxID=671077 RepID=UPI0029F50A5F|nr:glycosyltransferase family 2 protein [Caldinitratiruptor microaerophilus]
MAAVIPAYNEEATIADVVAAVRQAGGIDPIVVVADGCTDRTAERARDAGALVVEHPENRGKAAAMKTGISATDSDVVVFLDADLVGLTREHVRALVAPVLAGEADMAIGLFDDGRLATDLAQVLAPYLSGQRAVRRRLIERMFAEEPEADVSRFGIEVALTRFAERAGLRVKEVPLEALTHRTKEEKLGLVKGLAARVKMYWEILKYAQKG